MQYSPNHTDNNVTRIIGTLSHENYSFVPDGSSFVVQNNAVRDGSITLTPPSERLSGSLNKISFCLKACDYGVKSGRWPCESSTIPALSIWWKTDTSLYLPTKPKNILTKENHNWKPWLSSALLRPRIALKSNLYQNRLWGRKARTSNKWGKWMYKWGKWMYKRRWRGQRWRSSVRKEWWKGKKVRCCRYKAISSFLGIVSKMSYSLASNSTLSLSQGRSSCVSDNRVIHYYCISIYSQKWRSLWRTVSINISHLRFNNRLIFSFLHILW